MEASIIPGDMTVAEVLSRWPQTIPVFLQHRLNCVGCAMAPFENLADVAEAYGLDVISLIQELSGAASTALGPGVPPGCPPI